MSQKPPDPYTPEEKLALVAQELMDPKEIGLTTAEEARLQILPDAKVPRKLEGFIVFEASEVPLDRRAQFAYDALKVIPPDKELWLAEWKVEHKDEIFLQARTRCGNATAVTGGRASDQVMGLINLMEDAAKMLRDEYDRERSEA